MGTQHRPDSVRSCEPALRAVGVAGGPLWGGGVPQAVVRGHLESLSVYGVSSGIQWGSCVAEGIRGSGCRWLWCVVSSGTYSSRGVWLVFWCLACVSAHPLPYV